LVVDDCSSALELNDTYLKVLVRRSQALESLEKYDEALSDMKRVIELDPSFPRGQETMSVLLSPLLSHLSRARLQRKHDQKLEEMKTEALGKLKELGNSFLGNFGMSLDNFKMEQDKATGSWSIRSPLPPSSDSPPPSA
jgi:tetratricopeptide (TPR) repeat protein